MRVVLPNLQGQERNTLYIMGNGFDLDHNLKTRYWDFRQWLLEHNYDDFVREMEMMFPEINDNKLLLWEDFETALEKADPLKIHQLFFQGVDDAWYDSKTQHVAIDRIKPRLDRIPELLRDWLIDATKNIYDVPCKYDLSRDSLYLSFNYTLLLEKVYSIPSERIFHIHNSIDNKETLVTGHKHTYNEDVEISNVNIEKSMLFISQGLNKLKKPVDEIIKNNLFFFKSLSNIANIIVFGFSLSPIDLSYFKEILLNVHDNAHWYFVCHDEKSKYRYETIVNKYANLPQYYYDRGRYARKINEDNCCYLYVSRE